MWLVNGPLSGLNEDCFCQTVARAADVCMAGLWGGLILCVCESVFPLLPIQTALLPVTTL